MRLIVLDTNVIVSAAIQPESAPAKILMDWVLEGRVQVVTSPAVIAEYREVVRRPKFRRYGFPPAWLEFLIDESLTLQPLHDSHFAAQNFPDPKDIPFLALADTAGAWLVTGNLKHFPETLRKGVRVLSPSEYLRHLKG